MRVIAIMIDIVGTVAIFSVCGSTMLGFFLTVGLYCATSVLATVCEE